MQSVDAAWRAWLDTLGTVGSDELARPGLGEWNVRELIAHTLRAATTVDRFLDEVRPAIEVPDAERYCELADSMTEAQHAAVAQRGRDGAEALPSDAPALRVAAVCVVEATLRRLRVTTGEEVGATAFGAMGLDEYLRTRLVEVITHHRDLCHALGRPVSQPVDAVDEVAAILPR
ncbi:MAG: maleylpyruvate isomerase N-terminal domain-containing protein [Microthrixaceae bacterium]